MSGKISVANDTAVTIKGTRTLQVDILQYDSKQITGTLKEVLFYLNFGYILVSESKVEKDGFSIILKNSQHCF